MQHKRALEGAEYPEEHCHCRLSTWPKMQWQYKCTIDKTKSNSNLQDNCKRHMNIHELRCTAVLGGRPRENSIFLKFK